MYYFAYGSNMDPNQMEKRCPLSKSVSIAILPHYELHFPRRSKKRNCGVASIMQCNGKNVWGVIYDIPNKVDFNNLDKKEGFYGEGNPQNCYERKHRVFYLDGDKKNRIMADTYIALLVPNNPFLPSPEYLKTIINGANSHNLPNHYVNELSQILTK